MKKAAFTTALLSGLLMVPALGGAQETPPDVIRLHGAWTVEVWEDDALVQRHEFQNALTPGGAERLLQVMAGTQTAGMWLIDIDAEFGTGGGGTVECASFELYNDGGCFPFVSGNQVTLPTTGENAGSLVVEGTRVNDDGSITITGVATGLQICANSLSPAGCQQDDAVSWSLITERVLDAPVTATAGQEVRIQVVLSLS